MKRLLLLSSFVPAALYLTKSKQEQKAFNFYDYDDKIKNIFLKKSTDIFIWGNGYVNNTSIYTNFHPHRIKSFLGKIKPEDIMDVSFGEYLAAVIDKNFNLFIWKEPKLNSEKDPSINNHERGDLRKLAENLKVAYTTFTKDKLFILDKKGDVYFYNISINQPRGDEFFQNSLPEPEVRIEEKLIHVKELKNIKMIATGKDHFIAVDKEGNLYGMGDDSFGQLGTGNYSKERELQMKLYYNFIQRRERLPIKISIPEKIQKIACGENHTVVLSEGGNVYGFGNNRFLQLSNDELYRKHMIGLNTPTLIVSEKFKGFRIVDIVCSKNCSFFVCKNESKGTYHFFSAGEGLKGELGQNLIKHISDIGEMPDISGLVNSETLKPFEPLKLTCGSNHCLLLFKNPRVMYVWGNNEFGELGTRDRIFYESPIPMLEEYNLPYKIMNISAGCKSSAFICEKVDPTKKKEIMENERREEEEENKKKKRRKKRITPKPDVAKEQEHKDETQSNFSISKILNELRKYI